MEKRESDSKNDAPEEKKDEVAVHLTGRKKAVFVVVFIVALFLLAEGCTRARQLAKYGTLGPKRAAEAGKIGAGDLYMTHPYIGAVLVPNALIADSAGTTEIGINSLGYRGPEIEKEKPEETFRILCLGGSTTFGTGAPTNADTWTFKLEKLLRGEYIASGGYPNLPYSNIEVVNAGVPAYTTAESLINLQLRGVDLSPDLVIVYHAYNDLKANRPPGEFKTDYSHFKPAVLGAPEPTLADRLCKVSLFLYKIRKNIRSGKEKNLDEELKKKGLELPSEIYPEGLETFRRNLDSIAAVSRACGADAMLVTFARGVDENTPREELLKRLEEDKYYIYNLSPEGILKGLREYNKVIRSVAQSKGTLFADNEKEFPVDPALFTDDIHFKPEGADAMAGILFRTIKESRIIETK